jgi:hypothetical protein
MGFWNVDIHDFLRFVLYKVYKSCYFFLNLLFNFNSMQLYANLFISINSLAWSLQKNFMLKISRKLLSKAKIPDIHFPEKTYFNYFL